MNQEKQREVAAKLAEQEAAIRAEERAKAEEEAKAHSKVEAEAKAKELMEHQIEQPFSDVLPAVIESVVKKWSAAVMHSGSKAEVVNIRRSSRPSDNDMIDAIQHAFGASYGEACDWLLEVAESLKVAA